MTILFQLINKEPNQGYLSPLLHPQLPALSRPAPPLSSLHFFTVETEEEAKLKEELGLGNGNAMETDEDDIAEVIETVVVPVAPNDVRAGKKDVADVTLPTLAPGHTVLRTPDAPQPGHYPPIPVTALQATSTSSLSSVIPPPKKSGPIQTISIPSPAEAVQAKAVESGMGDEAFVSFDTIPPEPLSGSRKDTTASEGMEVDDEDSDEGIPDLDSELSGFEDDDDDEEGE